MNKDFIYNKIYSVSIGVMIISMALMLFIQGMVPFGVSASWSADGAGAVFVLTKPDAMATVGSKVAGQAETQGKVNLFTVDGITRQNGTVQYEVLKYGSTDTAIVPAQELGRIVVLQVPFVGVWVRVLQSELGALTLIGLPFFMLFIHFAMRVGSVCMPVLHAVGMKFAQHREARNFAREQRNMEKKLHESRQKTYVHEETESVVSRRSQEKVAGDDYVTVLKPYGGIRHGYGV